jgi:O-antigen ligase
MRSGLVAFLSSSVGLLVVAVTFAILGVALTVAVTRLLVGALSPPLDCPQVPLRAGVVLAALLVAAVLLIPTIFTIASTDVFVLPKLTALRVALVVGLILFVLEEIRRPNSDPLTVSGRARDVDIVLFVYVVLAALATMASMDPAHSLVGENEQYQGFTTTLLYVAYFYLARAAVSDRRRLALIAIGATVGCTIVSAYALLQQFHLDPLWTTLNNGAVFSTLGQHEWLGAYLVLGLAMCVATFWQVGPIGRIFSGLALVVIVHILLVALSRGAYLGAAAATVVFVASLAPYAHPNRRWLRAVPGLALLVLLEGGLFLLPPEQQEIGLVTSRAASTTDLGESSIESRLDLWRVGIEITLDHPILGTGPETFPIVFPQYRDSLPANDRSGWLAWRPESPHNVYLEISAGAGVPALAVYVALLAAVFLRIGRALALAPSGAVRVMLAAVLAAGVGHVVTDFFMTAEITSSWLFWVLLGAGLGYAETLKVNTARRASASSAGPRSSTCILLQNDSITPNGEAHMAPPRAAPRCTRSPSTGYLSCH